MRTSKITFAACALALAALALPHSAQAADWDMVVNDKDSKASTWHYTVTSSDPGSGSGCASSSSTWHDTGYLDVFSLGQPYSGSSVRSRWVTLCKNGNYVTYELIISMNNCGFWICDVDWTRKTTRVHNVSHSHEITGSLFTRELDVILNP